MTHQPYSYVVLRYVPDQGAGEGLNIGVVVYAVCSHRYADHWIINRTLTAPAAGTGANGYDLLCASDDDVNDFHACNLSFRWPR